MQRNPIFIQSYLKRSTRKLFREEPVQRLHVWQITLNTDCDNVSFSEPAKYRNKLKHINFSSSRNQKFIYPPLALTITPIFGERRFVFSTRIPIIILLFYSETKWIWWSRRWVTSAHLSAIAKQKGWFSTYYTTVIRINTILLQNCCE